MAEKHLKVLIAIRKDKLKEIKKGYFELDDQYTLSAKLVLAMIKDYEFLISELEQVLKIMSSER